MKTKILLLTLAVAFPAASSLAQGQGRPPGPPPGKHGPPPDGQSGQKPPGGPPDGDHPPGPPPSPLLHALDTDDDGIISAEEIKNAPAALMKLDKNGDKQITPDELRPPPKDGKKGGGDQSQKKSSSDKTDKKTTDWPFAKDKTGSSTDQEKSTTSSSDQGSKGDKGNKGDKPPGPPPSPLFDALDTDHDGIISEEEIKKASESLLKLDKNGDGQLGPREYNAPPPHPPGPPPEDAPKDSAQKPAQ